VRHARALEGAAAALARAEVAAREGVSEEFISVELRSALGELGEIVGAVTTEDLLERIFSTFCIGK